MSSKSKPGPRPIPDYRGPWDFPAPSLEGWGKALADWRKATRCTREALAARLGVSLLTVREWEKGRSFPTLATRKKIEEAREK